MSRSTVQPANAHEAPLFIFAVDLASTIRVAPDGDRPTPGSVKHETLFHNADVLAAGEIWINEGVIAGLNDLSGSYGTAGELEANPAFSTAILSAINRLGLPIADQLKEMLHELRSP